MRRLVVLMCLALAGCSGPAPEQSAPPPQSKDAARPAAPAPTAAAPVPTPPAEPEPAYPLLAGGRTVFASGPAGTGLRWQAGLAPCKEGRCPVTIWLLENGKVIDSVATARPASSAQVRREAIEAGWGAGDPAATDPNAMVWASGEEERYTGIVVRPVNLPATPAVLVDQLTGFEHLRRHHELFVIRERKLSRVWTGEEGAGPAWTSTAIVPAGDAQAILYYDGFRYPTPAQPDKLEITLLRWENSALARSAVPDARRALVTGAFPNAQTAHRERDANRKCLAAFWVLPAEQFPGRPGRYLLALPAASRQTLDQRLDALKACSYNQEVQILAMR